MCSRPAFWQHVLTTYQTTFCDNPLPHTFPFLATLRKILSSVTLAAPVHWSSAALTQLGMGTVRMWPPLPIRSTTAQCPWRIWMSSNSKPTSSDLRKPQPNNMAHIAYSRLARLLSPRECWSTSELCSALNQLPERNPSYLTPLTRLIPAANSGLSKPESAASWARRRTAASCWLIVLAAR